MADRFLCEIKRMHQLRQHINEMSPEEADELIRGLGDDAAEDWIFAARDAQLPTLRDAGSRYAGDYLISGPHWKGVVPEG